MPVKGLLASVLEHVDAVLFLALDGEEQGVMVVGVDVMGEASRSALFLEDAQTGVDVDAASGEHGGEEIDAAVAGGLRTNE